MQLVRTLAAWRPDLTAYRDVDSAYRIGLKSLARRYLELHDEIADLDAMIAAIVDELAPNLVARNSIGHIGAAQAEDAVRVMENNFMGGDLKAVGSF
jgi:transposase